MAIEAKKFEFAVADNSGVITGVTIPAYKEGDLAVHQIEINQEKRWVVSHIKTGCQVMQTKTSYLKKRYAKAHAEELNNHAIDWDFSSVEEMNKKNSLSKLIKACDEAAKAGKSLVDLDA